MLLNAMFADKIDGAALEFPMMLIMETFIDFAPERKRQRQRESERWGEYDWV